MSGHPALLYMEVVTVKYTSSESHSSPESHSSASSKSFPYSKCQIIGVFEVFEQTSETRSVYIPCQCQYDICNENAIRETLFQTSGVNCTTDTCKWSNEDSRGCALQLSFKEPSLVTQMVIRPELTKHWKLKYFAAERKGQKWTWPYRPKWDAFDQTHI